MQNPYLYLLQGPQGYAPCAAGSTSRMTMSYDLRDHPSLLVQVMPDRTPATSIRKGTGVPAETAVYVRSPNGLQRVCRTTIRCLCADGNYVEMRTDNKRFILRGSLCDVIRQLGTDGFPQVNRHTAVNLHRLDRVDHDSVELDGDVFTLSRSYRQALMDRLQVICGR